MNDLAEQLLLLIAGASLTLAGAIVKSWLDRRTHSSTRVFEMRVDALNRIWQAFNEMKGLYASRVERGLAEWESEVSHDARRALTHFRRSIDNAQVVLPAEVIDVLRRIDEVYFLYDGNPDAIGIQFLRDVRVLLQELTTVVNAAMSQPTHQLDLRLRT